MFASFRSTAIDAFTLLLPLIADTTSMAVTGKFGLILKVTSDFDGSCLNTVSTICYRTIVKSFYWQCNQHGRKAGFPLTYFAGRQGNLRQRKLEKHFGRKISAPGQ